MSNKNIEIITVVQLFSIFKKKDTPKVSVKLPGCLLKSIFSVYFNASNALVMAF
jgi:hypothetical protein